MGLKKFLKNYYLLILILSLAAWLRFYQITIVPPSTQWDETAIGYNAYSILKTGRDEYGNFLPLIFKSFGDYKPGLYIYLTVPSVLIFGLNELAVRIPSALAGIASVWLIYQVSLLLFKKKPLSLFISFALAMSPWAMHFSRGGWEANLVLFLLLAGVLCFLKSEPKKIKWLYFSALSFGLSFLAYQGSKVFVPLLLLGLLIFFFKKIKALPLKNLIISLVLLFLIASPAFLAVLTGGGGRLKTMSLFSYLRPPNEIQHILSEDNNNLFYFNLFHHEGLSFATRLAERYFNHFSGRFLFFEGDWSSLRHGPPYTGVLYLFDFFLLLIGGSFFIRLKTNQSKFVWFWLFMAPLPAVLTRDSIHGVRSLNMVLPLMILVGGGLYQLFLWLQKPRKVLTVGFTLILAVFYFSSVAYCLEQYFYHYPLQSSQYWQYGYKQVIHRVYPIKDQYEKIIFTQKWGQPYIYWLFYTQYPPANYQKQAKLKENPSGDVGEVEKLDNIEFRNVYWPTDRNLNKFLFIATEEEISLKDIEPGRARFLGDIKFLDGRVAFRVVETL